LLERHFRPLPLPEAFPIYGPAPHRQVDAEITYLHVHNGLELGYCHRGSGVFVVENKVMPFHAGDACVINDREMHLAQSTPGTSSDWEFTTLNPAALVGIPTTMDWHAEELSISRLGGPYFHNVISGNEHPEIIQLILAINRELTGKREGFQSVVRAHVRALMILLHRLPGTTKAVATDRASCIKRIAPALSYLYHHYRNSVRVQDLASVCHMSLTHFRRLFHQATGESPQSYLKQFRIHMAKTLLTNSDASILDISGKVGFPTLSSLNRHFKATTGMSPREFRLHGKGVTDE